MLIQSHLSTTESIDEAMRQIQVYNEQDSEVYVPILFVIRMWNLMSYPGFRLNQPIYSAYPQEKEHLIPADTMLWIYGIEQIAILNFSIKKLNGSHVTVIYLDAYNY